MIFKQIFLRIGNFKRFYAKNFLLKNELSSLDYILSTENVFL